MAIRTIILKGDELLAKKSRPVTDFDARLHILLDDMRETLAENDGLGLAAVQVGVLRRIFIALDLDSEGEEKLIEFINPEIVETEGEQQNIEGCLSVPGVYGFTKRPNYVKMRAQNREGEFFEVDGTELFARELMHEYDHLDGELFSEKVIRYLTEEEIEAMNAGAGDGADDHYGDISLEDENGAEEN
jgi:peptide deformylase